MSATIPCKVLSEGQTQKYDDKCKFDQNENLSLKTIISGDCFYCDMGNCSYGSSANCEDLYDCYRGHCLYCDHYEKIDQI